MSLGNWNVEAYWNASTNTPKLVSGRGTNGKGYIVNTPGSTTLDGVSTWAQGDILVLCLISGLRWEAVLVAAVEAALSQPEPSLKLRTRR
jgi:hypothetical protein